MSEKIEQKALIIIIIKFLFFFFFSYHHYEYYFYFNFFFQFNFNFVFIIRQQQLVCWFKSDGLKLAGTGDKISTINATERLQTH